LVKSDDRRDAILDQLANHVLAHGLAASSLRPLAKAAGLSDRMLLYYFKDKNELVEATLDKIVARLTVRLNNVVSTHKLPLDALATKLLAILLAEDLWPYMCVWLEIAALAARGDPLYRTLGGQIGKGFLAWGAAQLDAPSNATALLVRIEGTILLHSLGMAT
jgi:AcrR family transcriptional regulator